MSRYRSKVTDQTVRRESTANRPPPFDLARQWRHPVVLGFASLLLIVVTGLIIEGFRPVPLVPPVASVLAVDVSESALQNSTWTLAEMCDRYKSYLQVGDRHTNLWFAEKAREIGQKMIAAPPDEPVDEPACDLPPSPEDLEKHELGQQPGTALTLAIQEASRVAQQSKSRYPDLPMMVVIVLHKLEPGETESGIVRDLEIPIQALAKEVHAVWLIGPQGDLATKIGNLFDPIENATFCPLNDPKQQIDRCFQDAFQDVRALGRAIN